MALLSNNVPDWSTLGAPGLMTFCSSYHLAASRLFEAPATPVLLTPIFWAVHRRPLRRWAAYRRSSSASRRPPLPPVLPRCGTSTGKRVGRGVAMEMLALIVGDGPRLPGLVTRRSISVLNVALSTPMKYPSAVGPVLAGL